MKSPQIALRPQPVPVERRGQVASGRGNAGPELHALRREVEAIVGEPIFPGSINLILNAPLRLRAGAARTFDDGKRMLWPATFNGIDVWVYRWRSCPLHIVEVVSAIHVRSYFQLADGDRVTLGLDAALIEGLRAVDRVIWAMLWLGRERWAYSAEPYFRRVENWGMNLGAAQQRPIPRGPVQLIARMLKR